MLFIAVGIFFVSGENYHPFWGRGTGTFGHAVFLALWPLQGFEIASLPAGETDNPQRAVPIATIGSLLCVTDSMCWCRQCQWGCLPAWRHQQKNRWLMLLRFL